MKRGERGTSKRGEPSSSSSQRSVSPIGLSTILKPTKWFQRSNSSKSNLSPTVEGRTSLSKISNPTNPRPYNQETLTPTGSRSVLNLSMNRSTSQLAVSIPQSSSSSVQSGPGSGDLRAASGKKWSKSVDDLSKFSPESPISPSSLFSARIGEYRSAIPQPSGSTLLTTAPTSTRAPSSAGPGTVAFPTKLMTEDEDSSSKKHGRSLSFGRLHPSNIQPTPSAIPVPVPRLPTKSTSSVKTVQTATATARSGHQMVTSLNPVGAPSRPSYERSPGSGPSGAGGANPGYNVRAFAFPFGITHKPSSSPPQIVLSSALESGSNATLATTKASKRSSRMVMHQGFLMRLDHPTQAEKGKPFKGVLTGNKLQLYKPSSDKAAELKELFPEGLVPHDIEEEGEEPEAVSPGGATTNRAKRKYWGRTRHPELQIIGDDRELQGTLDALVHEAVFGTTFDSRTEKEIFAQTVLLCLPNVLPQHSDFDEAFMRYLGSAFRTLGQDDHCGEATEEKSTKEKEWLEWLVGTYVLLYGGLVGDGWDDWLETVDLQLDSCVSRAREASGGLGASPYVGVFSPRPGEAGTFESISTSSPQLGASVSMHALAPPPGTAIPVNAITSETIAEFLARPSKLGNTLDRDRLSRDVFLKVPSGTIAKALRVLNQVFLVQAVHGSSSTTGHVGLSPSRYFRLPRGTDPASLFCGSDNVPHWLTRLVMTQVLSPDMVGHELPASDTAGSIGVAAGHNIGIIPEGVKVSRTHTRAAVLCKWIRLGELARVNGDECTWRAIQAAVCSRAIARLERVFRRMSDEEREIVSVWAREDRPTPQDHKCTPWESDVRERIGREMEHARVKGGASWSVKPFGNAWSMVQEMGEAWGKCTSGVLPWGDSDVEDVVGLVRYFRRHAEDEELVKSKHISDYNGLSFAIEPRRNRYYAPHFFRNKGTQSTHPLTPLLFPELMPTVNMLDRSHIVRGKKLSSTPHGDGTGPVEMSQEHIQEVVTRTRAFQSGGQGQSKGKEVRLLGEDLGETTLTVFGGELVLKLVKEEKNPGERVLSRSTTMLRNVSRPASVVEEDGLEELSASLSGILSPTSSGALSPGSTGLRLERRPSRSPSIRATPSSHLERKQSAIRSRRSSLPSISQRTSVVVTEASGEPPLRALVSSGSLEKLVDVLVSGLEEVGMQTSPADDNGETSLREGRTRGIRVDHAEYCRIFWGVFRSFVTPMVLFEMIRKRYQNAANKKSLTPSNLIRFSSHSNPDKTEDDHYRFEVTQALINWIIEGGGGQDLLDDTDFYDAMYKFLFHSESAQLEPLRELFKRVTRRPNLETAPVPSAGHSSTGFGSAVPSLDDTDPESLADNLDAIAAAALKPVTLTDLIVALDLLETQSVDKLGWYVVSDLPPTGDDTPIQNIYTQLQEVDTSPLISEMGPEKFVRNLPSSIRSVFRAHDIVRRWALMNIIAPRLGVQVRQERIELFLRTIEVCRLRTADSPSSQDIRSQDIRQPSIRTFTETALGAALCSPESRLFTKAWQEVGAARGASIESLSSLLSVRRVEKIRSPRRMTADMGWLIECLLELSCLPDKSSEGGSGVELLNFDKRRYLFNLMSNVPNLQPLRKQQLRSNTHRADVDRMTNMQREVSDLYYEARVIKEEAHRENTHTATHHAPPRKVVRPFHRLVADQNEKNRRDKYARERLQKEIKNERLISERRDDNIAKAMLPKGGHGQRKKSRSMSGFFTMLRPISSAWSGDKFHDKMLKPRTLQELDFEPSGKPSIVLNVANAQVQDFVNNQRSFVMRLRTEDGALYYLQALDHHDATRWLAVLQETSSTYARRRLTYQAGKSDPAETGAPSFNATTKHPNPVYGVPLEELLEREYGSPPPTDAVPHIIKICIQEVESRGLTEPGIYRLVPSTTELAQLRDMFDSGAAFEGQLDPHTDIMAYTSALKAWFRSLPECIFTDALYNDFIAAAREPDGNTKAAQLHELVFSLPNANFQLLKVMFEHLDHVIECEPDNHMSAENVATCLAQSLVFPPGGTGGSIFPINLGEHHQLVKCLILQNNQVFQEPVEEGEPEAQVEGDDAYEDIIEEQAVASESEEELENIPITRASTSKLDMFDEDVFTTGVTQHVNETWSRNRAGS